ncbi:hypothetical protein HNQ59_000142 [Chitinivorax tropicus]|uniref:Cell division protein ZipA n=1 Tax=Chitinivorax tropicus TaxID=714531 RepID=A0A840MER6_9PROT|nr:cell division protein ZipA C-terminal FtsZ-binding domain-containing protein [Chitinivorax tropicus]MBB5016880.1 hypothetical protein [Chitinivorax tropicus]
MSDLNLALIVAAVGIIGGVWALNWWQERSFRRKAEQAFEKPAEDVLLERKPKTAARAEPDTPRLEPSLVDTSPAVTPVTSPSPQAETTAALSVLPNTVLDSGIDFIAELHLTEPVAVRNLQVSMEDAANIGKPVRWSGLDAEGEHWSMIHPGAAGSFRQLRVGLQLADRKGPVSDAQLLEFVRIIRLVGEDIGAVVELPQRTPALMAATDLDTFCADVDVLIGLNIVSRDGTPFSATKIRALCEAAGMQLADDGLFHLRNEHGQTLFSLCNLGQESFSSATIRQMKVNAVTLLFDVPRVVGGVSVFDRVAKLADHLAESLDGELVDDNRRPLNEQGLGAIRRQLIELYRRMEQRGIQPGSPTALRLFA